VLEFDSIYRTYFRFVWACSRRLGVGPAEVEDVVQEIFLVIHAKLDTVRNPESLRSWIYGIVRRTVSSHRRSAQARTERPSFAPEAPVAAAGPTPADLAERNADALLLARLLDSLSEAKREVFILSELEEMSAPEIASALEIPLNTAYSRLRHARADFETALARHRANQRGRS